VQIESQAVIGGALGVHQFVHIGRLAMVGGMSRIDRDVPPFMLIEGNPARVRSLNQVGLRRSGWVDQNDGETFRQLKQAFRLLYRSKTSFQSAVEQLDELVEQAKDNELLNHLSQFIQSSRTKGRRGLIPGGKRSSD
ncbi:MAG: acyl-[acyl-carrier-protein]--UDP-N-acetylglucosamine O-acyltransferase, partial [Merismopedia sp. SIO2A8]|nr:acyl-[acyl-carrier-protein]--UDP-N-acetylglucosamine O-acyltransferase [Merismopedia sp. SIO2A8]